MGHVTGCAELLRVLQEFMSDTAARVVLRGTLEPLRLSLGSVGMAELPRVIQALEPATRHFVDPSRRAVLANRLRTLVAPAPSFSAAPPTASPTASPTAVAEDRSTTLVVRTEADASHARLTARSLCESMGAGGFECQKVSTAVSELARNQIAYASGGTIHLSARQLPRRLLRVRAEDQGRGIPDLERVLSGNYRSKTGMGLGLLGIKRLANRFDVSTGPTGTQVEVDVWL